MADLFDVVDVFYGWLKGGGIKTYKDKRPINPKTENYFAVVSTLKAFEGQVLSNIPVNINLHFKKNSNGMISRNEMKAAKRKVKQLIENGTYPNYYFDVSPGFEQIDTSHDTQFDLILMRFDVTVTT